MTHFHFNKTNTIDCSIPCPLIIKTLSSCPSRIINFDYPTSQDFHEISMVLLSCTPYPTCFFILLLGSYFRTTRMLLIFIMEVIQNFLVNIIKNIIQDPRPNFKCNHQFGNPSNHASFYTCIVIWFIIEEIFTHSKKQFKFKKLLVPLYIVYPFILYSRYYLNYHSMEQIVTGIIFGFFVSVFWYFICVKFILRYDNPIKRIFQKLNIKNTLTYDKISNRDYNENEDLIKQYQSLLEKNEKIEQLKENLQKITQNIKNLDFMKEQKKMMHLDDDDDDDD